MGSFYANHTVCAPNLSIIESIEKIRPAFVSKNENGCLVVFDEQSENQDEEYMQDTNILLSQKTGGVVLSALIHDDSMLLYWLSINGKIVQKYNSMPSLFLDEEPRPPEGGNSSELCAAFGIMNVEQVEQILRADLASEKYVFETDMKKRGNIKKRDIYL